MAKDGEIPKGCSFKHNARTRAELDVWLGVMDCLLGMGYMDNAHRQQLADRAVELMRESEPSSPSRDPTTAVKIAIVVRGGMVKTVLGSHDVSVTVFDFDSSDVRESSVPWELGEIEFDLADDTFGR